MSGELKWRGFISVAFGTFMATIDFSALTVGLPQIARDFNAVITDLEWVIVAYSLTIGALLLPLGRCGDHWGKHRLFKMGFVVFVISSGLCAFSQSVFQLIFWRVFQGIGGAIYMSVGSAILVDSFPTAQRGKALGFMGTIVSLGLMLGAPVGGFLTYYLSWRAIFLINIPIGIIGLIWTYYFLPKDELRENHFRFDVKGAFLSIGASTSLLCILTRISVLGITSYYIWGLFLVFLVTSVLFFIVEKKNPYGILDLALFRNKFFARSNFSLLLYSISLHMVYFLVPFYLADVLLYSQKRVGLVMMAIPMMFSLLNPVTGWFSDKIGTRVLAPLGLLIAALAYLRMGQLTEVSLMHEVVLTLFLVGIAAGFFQAPNASGIMGSVSRLHLGTASALIATMRNFGGVMGVAVATTLFAFRVRAHDGVGFKFSIHELPPNLFIKAFHDTLWGGAFIVTAALLFSLFRGPDPGR